MSLPGPPIVYPKPKVAADRLQFWWYPPSDVGDSPIISYTLTCPGVFTQIYSADVFYAAVTSGISVGTTYTFSVYATNGAGDGPAASFIPVAPCSPPGAPTNLTGKFVGSDGIEVSWTPPVNTGGADLTYNLVTAYPISIDYGSTIKQSGTGPINSIYLSPLVSTLSYNLLVQTRNFNTYSPQNAFLPTLTYGTTPSNISTLSLWLDASDYSSLYSDSGATQNITYGGGSISAWRDKSTSNNLLIAANPDYPSFHTVTGLHTEIQGVGLKYFPAIQSSNNTEQFMSSSSLTVSATNELSILCLFRWTQFNSSTSSNILFELFDGNVRLNQFGTALQITCDGEAGQINTNGFSEETALLLLTANQTNVNATLFAKGVVYQRSFIRDNTITFTTPTNIQTCRMTPDPDTTVRMGELLLYGSTLSVAEQVDLYSYFRTKWGIQYADNKGDITIVGPGVPYIVSTPYTFSILYENKEPVVYTVVSDNWTVNDVSIGSSTTLTPGPTDTTIATKDTQFDTTGSTTIGYSITTLEFGVITSTPLTISVVSEAGGTVSITMGRTPDTDVLTNQNIQFNSEFYLNGVTSMDYTSVSWSLPGGSAEQNPIASFPTAGTFSPTVTYTYNTIPYESTITGINVLNELTISTDKNVTELTETVTFTINNPSLIAYSSGDWQINGNGQGSDITPFVYSSWGSVGVYSVTFAYTANLDPNPRTTNTEVITVYDQNPTIGATPESPATTTQQLSFQINGIPDSIVDSYTWTVTGAISGGVDLGAIGATITQTTLLIPGNTLSADTYTIQYGCTLTNLVPLTAALNNYQVNAPA